MYGVPTTSQHSTLLCKKAYSIIHNDACKVPFVSLEKLTKQQVGGTEPRSATFKSDTALSTRATLADYAGRKNLEIDIGHMVPAGDFTTDPTAMSQSFLLSNAVPQAEKMNRGIWRMLEMRARALAVKYGEIYIYTGGVYSENSKTIGSGVCVPTHLFKVIISPTLAEGIAYLIPNENSTSKQKFTNFATTIHEVEKVTKFNFAPKVPESSSIKQEIGKRLSGS